MKVSKKTLLFIAGTVWLIAGINILRIGLRVSGLVPEVFIAIFYSGLGLSLIIAGLGFCRQFIKYP